MAFYKGVAKKKLSNIRVLLAEADIPPWGLPQIGFFEKEGIMEVIYYKDDREKVREALQKFSNVKKIKGEKFLESLSPPDIRKLYKRMEIIKNLRKCSEPVKRFFRIFKKRWLG